MIQCILFFHFVFCEKAQKERSLKDSNTVKLARKRGLEAAFTASCDSPGVLLLFRFNVSTATASPPWGQREETRSLSLSLSFISPKPLPQPSPTAAFCRCSNKKPDLFVNEADKAHCFQWPPSHCFSCTTSHLKNY